MGRNFELVFDLGQKPARAYPGVEAFLDGASDWPHGHSYWAVVQYRAMAVGVTDPFWGIGDIVKVLED